MLRGPFRKPAEEVHRHLADALRRPDRSGCPECRWGERTEERFLTSFLTEHYTDPGILRELRGSLGFCPEHTRAIVARPEAPYVMTAVFAEIVDGARQWLASAARHGTVPRPCPACRSRDESERAFADALLAALDVPAVRDAYRAAGGFCLRHLDAALRTLPSRDPAETVSTLVQVFAEQLVRAREPETLVPRLGGPDPDAGHRGTARTRLAALARRLGPIGTRGPVLEDLRARLRVNACPACVCAGLSELNYLEWLGAEWRRDVRALDADPPSLCGRHLHDLAQRDPVVVAWLAGRQRDELLGRIGRLAERLADASPRGTRRRYGQHGARIAPAEGAGRRRRRAALPAAARGLLGRRAARSRALAPFLTRRECSVCRAVASAVRRQLDLLVVALDDRRTAACYEDSHGLCLFHVRSLPAGARAERVTRVLKTHLAVLAWELRESLRKSDWSVRHEPKGGESSAWRRAAGFLDGRVYLGVPAESAAACAATT